MAFTISTAQKQDFFTNKTAYLLPIKFAIQGIWQEPGRQFKANDFVISYGGQTGVDPEVVTLI